MLRVTPALMTNDLNPDEIVNDQLHRNFPDASRDDITWTLRRRMPQIARQIADKERKTGFRAVYGKINRPRIERRLIELQGPLGAF